MFIVFILSWWEPILGTCVQDNEALNKLKWGDIFEYQRDCSISVRVVLHVAIYSCTYVQCLAVLSSGSEPDSASTAANNRNLKIKSLHTDLLRTRNFRRCQTTWHLIVSICGACSSCWLLYFFFYSVRVYVFFFVFWTVHFQ